jgi:hypothetical protein
MRFGAYSYIYILNLINAWMSWIRCATNILGAQQKLQISKMILDFFSGVLHVPVIYSAQIHNEIICVAMESFATAPNGLDGLLSHLMWEMLPHRCFGGVRIVRIHQTKV